MRPLIVLRPEPGARATVARAGTMGLATFAVPLFAVEPVHGTMPDPADFDALLVTSANAVRHGEALLAASARLPLFAVGEATAAAARRAGLSATPGGGTVETTLPLIAKAGLRRVLHVCGADVRAADAGPLQISRCVVYRAAACPPEDAAPALAALPGAVMLVHSARAGARLAELIPHDARARHRLVAISPAAAEACADGWDRIAMPSRPTDAAMLALAQDLCQDGPTKADGSGIDA